MTKPQLDIVVTDKCNRIVEDATIKVIPEAIGPTVLAGFDRVRKTYFAKDLRPGFFEVDLSHLKYDRQVTRVQVHPKGTQLRVILSPLRRRDLAYTYVARTRIEYPPNKRAVGLIFAPGQIEKEGAVHDLRELFRQTGQIPDWLLSTAGQNAAFGNVVIPPIASVTVPPDHSIGAALQVIRESRYVTAAGQFFQKSDTSITVFTHKMIVRFRPEVCLDEVKRILAQRGTKIVEAMSFAPNLFLVEAPISSVDEDINKHLEALLAVPSTIAADPNLAQWAAEDSTLPKGFLWPACWDRRLVRTVEAWEALAELAPSLRFGRPDLIIAVVDKGIKSHDGDAEHPDLGGTVSDNRKKVSQFFDFARMVPNNDCPAKGGEFLTVRVAADTCEEGASTHGVKCAGVAAATAHNPLRGDKVSSGLAGAAPNVRLMGIIVPSDDALCAQMFDWAAGQPTTSSYPCFPPPAREGADIITCSLGLGEGRPVPIAIQAMLDHITSRGRKGKGCLAVFSAGDSSEDIYTGRPYGSYERAFSCAASTIEQRGSEVRASYSGWGNLAWCVPSSSSTSMVHNPPTSYAVFTTFFLGAGEVPGFPKVKTELSNDTGPTANRVFLRRGTGIETNGAIMIGNPGRVGTEARTIVGDPNPETGELKLALDLTNQHSKGDVVFSGPRDYTSGFGQTSAAAPLSAGICALTLSANPKLTWVEAREILRSTACKIDLDNMRNDDIATWLDEDGVPTRRSGKPPVHSNGYGYGRLNAHEAVKAARRYEFSRDLMIRKNLKDSGRKPCAPSVNSPDIWVRNADPAIDNAAIPSSYGVAGPHQNPARETERWIYARVRNRGTEASLDAWVRFHLALSEVAEFPFPASWEPRNGIGNLTSTDWQLGTYFIGEVGLPAIAARSHLVVNFPWPRRMIPVHCVSSQRTWHFYLLVEITPQDGPLTGDQVHNNNNLAVKRITVCG